MIGGGAGAICLPRLCTLRTARCEFGHILTCAAGLEYDAIVPSSKPLGAQSTFSSGTRVTFCTALTSDNSNRCRQWQGTRTRAHGSRADSPLYCRRHGPCGWTPNGISSAAAVVKLTHGDQQMGHQESWPARGYRVSFMAQLELPSPRTDGLLWDGPIRSRRRNGMLNISRFAA